MELCPNLGLQLASQPSGRPRQLPGPPQLACLSHPARNLGSKEQGSCPEAGGRSQPVPHVTRRDTRSYGGHCHRRQSRIRVLHSSRPSPGTYRAYGWSRPSVAQSCGLYSLTTQNSVAQDWYMTVYGRAKGANPMSQRWTEINQTDRH